MKKRRLVVFGAGVAGLSVAHEFAQTGQWEIDVYEQLAVPGGFFRSDRLPPSQFSLATEYSWHGVGPWYHNTMSVMDEIPYYSSHAFVDTNRHTVYTDAISRGMSYGVIASDKPPDHIDDPFHSLDRIPDLSWFEKLVIVWSMLKVWTSSNQRSENVYSSQNAAHTFQSWMTPQSLSRWVSVFGPWIGSDWWNCSLHHVGHFFRKNFFPGRAHVHPADADGPMWSHGTSTRIQDSHGHTHYLPDGRYWCLLTRPSNEAWFDPWVEYLRLRHGVRFHFNTTLESLDVDRGRIQSALVRRERTQRRVTADCFILSINPFSAYDVLSNSAVAYSKAHPSSPSLFAFERQQHRMLTNQEPHVQISYRVAFDESIRWTRPRTALLLCDSEYNLTLFAYDQIWPEDDTGIGTGIKSLWTGTACTAHTPGRVHGKPMLLCTKSEFIDEILDQMYSCVGLNKLIEAANGGRPLTSFKRIMVEVWHEWKFPPEVPIVTGPQPKWVNRYGNNPYLPHQKTSIPNLFIAGAHTQTSADLWSIEAAVESGRRVASLVHPERSSRVILQSKPFWMRTCAMVDRLLYAARLPHLIDFILLLLVLSFCISLL